MKNIYFDNAATTQLHTEVIGHIATSLKAHYGNPSSIHSFGRSSKTQLEQSRKNIAKYLGVHPSEIIFTSGGTEADNLVLNSVVRDLKVKHIISSRIEHHAVLHTVERLEKDYNLDVNYVNVKTDGTIDYSHLETLLQKHPEKKLVSLMHINNEIGTLLDLDRVGLLCEEYNALFHSDMVQSIGRYPLNLENIPVNFAAASAHKFHGPKGIGFAYIQKKSGLRPLIFGGEQERGFRGGTEGVHNIVGMDKALQIAGDYLKKDSDYIIDLKNYFVRQLKDNLPKIVFNADSDKCGSNTYTMINISLPVTPEKATILLFHLDINGIACSKGSACQSGSIMVSHVLKEFLPAEVLQIPALRFSFSKYNTKEEVDYVIKVLCDFVAE